MLNLRDTYTSPRASEQHMHLVPRPAAGVSSGALSPSTTVELVHLDGEHTTIDGVDDDPTALEGIVGPGTRIPDSPSTTDLVIIFREDIKVSNLLDPLARGNKGDAGDIEDTETGLVVGLVSETVVDILVVVDGAHAGLVVAGLHGLLEVLDVPDVGDGVTVLGGGFGVGVSGVDFALVELVVHYEMGLPVGVENPALMSVGGALVGSAGDDGSGLGSDLVGDIVDGERVLVVAVADVAAVVLLVGSTVDDALGVVNVAVLGRAAGAVRLGGVLHVNVDETSSAGAVAGSGADCNGIAQLLVCNDVVRTSDGEIGEQTSQVGLGGEGLGLPGVDGEKLAQIKDLDTMADGLGTDDDVVSERLDLTPNRRDRLLGETAKVDQFTLLGHLNEGSAVGLADDHEVAALVGPTPRAGALAVNATKLLVSLEVVHVLLSMLGCGYT